MKNKFYEIIFQNLLTGFLLLMILPFGILFYFNNPQGDDWTYPDVAKSGGFLGSQVMLYKEWAGRYFSHPVLSYNPLYFHSILGVKILTLLIMLVFIYILFALISELTRSALNFKERFLLTLSIFFLYIYAMPSMPESFYWLSASITYQLGIILIMMFLILYAKISKQGESSSHVLLTFLSVLLLIAIAGCCEMSMVIGVFIISLLVICKLITKRKINARLFLFAITITLSSFVVILAPGNDARKNLFPNPDSHKILPSILTTFSTLIDYLVSWIFMSPLLFITLLTAPILFKLIKNSGKNHVRLFVEPLYTTIMFLVILFILFFTAVWSIGGSPYERTVNLIYFVFLIGWFYNAIVLMYYLSEKYNFNISRIPKYFYTFALIVVVLFLFKKNSIKNAYSDLLRGVAVKYNNELNERYDLIFKSSSDSLIVPALVNIPRTIFVGDMSSNPISNKWIAPYFNKKSISVIPMEFKLYPIYPRPFNPAAKIYFELPYDGKISLIVYDIFGKEVESLVNENRTGGFYSVDFKTTNLASGIYFCMLKGNKHQMTKKMMVVK